VSTTKTIAVIAPSGIPDQENLAQGVALLQSWGHRVILGRHIHQKWHYTAGTTQQRAEDLIWALTDPDVDVVWMARGGFGVQHCIPALPLLNATDRSVIASSDSTALLNYLYLHGHVNLFHGPMVTSLANGVDVATRTAVRGMLDNPKASGVIQCDNAMEPVRGTLTGPLVGGNIAVLASLAGSEWPLRTQGAILMLEDTTEHAFRLDRFLLQLCASGALEGASAIVLGEFVKCYLPADADYTASELVFELLKPLGVPILTGAQFGHGTTNLPWPYGRTVTLSGTSIIF
jgi:muramoyltetrapeptide carboxypeptidase